jgi:hypothetical protein
MKTVAALTMLLALCGGGISDRADNLSDLGRDHIWKRQLRSPTQCTMLNPGDVCAHWGRAVLRCDKSGGCTNYYAGDNPLGDWFDPVIEREHQWIKHERHHSAIIPN